MPVHALEVPTPLADRRSAGKLLAEGLESLAIDSPVVIGLARGGVPVAYEIAMYCGAPLDVLPVCRITAPDSTVTIGALAGGADPLFEIDKTQVRRLGVSQQWIADQVELHLESLERCRGLWRGTGISLPLRGRTLIVVDDSLATGCTARAALMSLARRQAERLILTVPFANPVALAGIQTLADEVVCLSRIAANCSAGYLNDGPVSDGEVSELLMQAADRPQL